MILSANEYTILMYCCFVYTFWKTRKVHDFKPHRIVLYILMYFCVSTRVCVCVCGLFCTFSHLHIKYKCMLSISHTLPVWFCIYLCEHSQIVNLYVKDHIYKIECVSIAHKYVWMGCGDDGRAFLVQRVFQRSIGLFMFRVYNIILTHHILYITICIYIYICICECRTQCGITRGKRTLISDEVSGGAEKYLCAHISTMTPPSRKNAYQVVRT